MSKHSAAPVAPFKVDASLWHNPFFQAALCALVGVLCFFVPFLEGGGRHAGFLFVSFDPWTLLGAFFYETRFLVHKGVFWGIDFFAHNGASELYLRPNLPGYHPLVLFLSAILPTKFAPSSLIIEYLILLAVPAFFCAFFTHRLATRFLKFDGPLATFLTFGFAFSMQVVASFWYMPFALTAWAFPPALYAALAAGEAQNKRTSFLWALAPLAAYLSGYVPLALNALFLSAAAALFLFREDILALKGKLRLKKIGWILSPHLIATVVAVPYYLELIRVNRLSEVAFNPGAGALDLVAHHMAMPLVNLLHSIAWHAPLLGLRYEFDIFLGIVPLLIVALFCFQKDVEIPKERRLLAQTSLLLFLFYALAVLGAASPLSDLFYFFVPLFGSMHLYQRYLIAAQFFLVVFLAILLDHLATNRERRGVRRLTALMAFIVLAAAPFIGHKEAPFISEKLVFEFLLALLFLLSFNFFSRKGIIRAAALAMFLLSLLGLYSYRHGDTNNYRKRKAEQITYSVNTTANFADFVNSLKPQASVLKYVDLVPHPLKYIPKNFPYFLAGQAKLASYYGYDWHLAAKWDYRKRFAVAAADDGTGNSWMRPDWEWAIKTGARYVLFDATANGNDPLLSKYADLSDPSRVYRTGEKNQYVFAPLRGAKDKEPNTFDNGIVRLTSANGKPEVTAFKTNYGNRIAFRLNAPEAAQMDFLYWPDKHLRLYIDGARQAWETGDDLFQARIPAGDHKIEILYVNRMLQLFLFLYAAYGIMWLSLALRLDRKAATVRAKRKKRAS